MSESPDKRSECWLASFRRVALASLIAAALLLGLYVGGYFVLSDYRRIMPSTGYSPAVHMRSFRNPQVAEAYGPLFQLECKIRKVQMAAAYEEE